MDKFLLRGAIVRKGFTQETLARALKMSQNTLSAKILGKSYFDTDEIDKICELLDITDNEEKAQIFLSAPSRNRDN
jgi:transcriptional regulator with XRE-family HTH domain